MKCWQIGSVLTLATLLLGAGCGKRGEPAESAPESAAPDTAAVHDPKQVVATVNDTKLRWADMEKRARSFYLDETSNKSLLIPAGREEEAMEYFRRKSVNVFVFKTLMLEEARRLKIKVEETDREEGLKRLEKALKSRNMTVEEFFSRPPFTEAEMRHEFEEGLVVDKLMETQIMAAVVVDNAAMDALAMELAAARSTKRQTAEGLRKQLLAGADFAGLAEAHSDCPSKRSGGDLGEFKRGQMVPEFDQAAFSQKVGEIGPIVETKFGYHIIKVAAHTPAQAATDTTPAIPETARASHILIKAPPVLGGKDLHNEIRSRKYKEGVDAFYKDLKSKARIETIFKDLVF